MNWLYRIWASLTSWYTAIVEANRETVVYNYTALEERLVRLFFTNVHGSVFLIHDQMPANMRSVLMAMYSRMTNDRGIRGVFVDTFLPSVLATMIPECHTQFGGEPEKLLKHYGIKGIEAFYRKWPYIVNRFLYKFKLDPDYLEQIAAGKRMRVFLVTWLDKYGHNSIARTATVYICFENISIRLAKSLEWNRPGIAIIELSTRYVKMSAAGLYKIWQDLARYGVDQGKIQVYLESFFDRYRKLQGDIELMDGPLPTFFREKYAALFSDRKKLEMGIFGETCDILGNLLPAAALTSVGIAISGEALPGLIKHLRLDDSPENERIADAIITECRKTGADQFLRHLDLTEWDRQNWYYLDGPVPTALPPREQVEAMLFSVVQAAKKGLANFDEFIEHLVGLAPERGEYGKLPRVFELVTVTFGGLMSYRGWRDLQRMGYCTHIRGHVDPANGFYKYDKPAPEILQTTFDEALAAATEMWNELERCGVPIPLREYLMPLGIMVQYSMSANLRQCEFMDWQREKSTANHEVRRIFDACEEALTQAYPWWKLISRADRTRAYLFARGSAIPLQEALERIAA